MIMMVNELIKILKEEAKLYEALFHVVSREREAMITYNLTDLIQCQKERQTMNLDVARLQESRVATLKEISMNISIPLEKLNISAILKNLQNEEANRLSECRDNLSAVIKKLSDVESGNRSIVRRSLSFIDQSVRILTGSPSIDPVYLSNGALGKNDNSGYRLRREA